jgi:hypothetical protein
LAPPRSDLLAEVDDIGEELSLVDADHVVILLSDLVHLVSEALKKKKIFKITNLLKKRKL